MSDNQKDLVLAPNEFAYVLDTTKGNITCWVGPSKTSLSQSDKLVTFDVKSKKFIDSHYDNAVQFSVTTPEGWYVILKNPASNNQHPTPGTANNTPEINVGRKINISGPANFALYPGQMATCH